MFCDRTARLKFSYFFFQSVRTIGFHPDPETHSSPSLPAPGASSQPSFSSASPFFVAVWPVQNKPTPTPPHKPPNTNPHTPHPPPKNQTPHKQRKPHPPTKTHHQPKQTTHHTQTPTNPKTPPNTSPPLFFPQHAFHFFTTLVVEEWTQSGALAMLWRRSIFGSVDRHFRPHLIHP